VSNPIMKCARRFAFPDRAVRSRPGARRKGRRSLIACEFLEYRTVLSQMGFGGPMGGMGFPGGMDSGWMGSPAEMTFAGPGPIAMAGSASPSDNLLGSLEQLGLLGTSGKDMSVDGSWGGTVSQTTQSSQLQTDQTKLQTDLQTLAAKSGVTVADLNNLANDDRALSIAGAQPDSSSLQTSLSALATAVASGADTTQAKSDLSKALAGSASVPQATLDTAVNDVVQAIQDSHVTTDDLTTIANDHSAIQKDLGIAPGGAPGVDASLVGNLANLGVLGSPGLGGLGGPMKFTGQGGRFGGQAIQGSQNTQLQTDQTKLQTDLQAIAAKSDVTVAELNNLATDDQAIAQATTKPDATKLQTGLTELATAVSAGTDTTQAVADINAAFANTGLSSSTINKAITDVTQIIQDSHITSDQLTTIAADHTAIQNDLAATGSNSTATASNTVAATSAVSTTTATTQSNMATTQSNTATTQSNTATTQSNTATPRLNAMATRIGHGRVVSMRAHHAHGLAHHGY
jgi:hypothetical protein